MSSRGSKSQRRSKIRKHSSDDEETMSKILRRSTRLQKRTRNVTNTIPITSRRIRTTTTTTATTGEISNNLENYLEPSFVDRITERINSQIKAISKATQIIPSDDEDVICINDSVTSDNVNNEALVISDESDIEELPTHLLRNGFTDTLQPSTSYANSNTRSINNELMDELQQQQSQQQQQNESYNLKKLEDLQKETEDLLKTTAITIQELSTENKPKEAIQKNDNNKGTEDVSESSSFKKDCPICLEPLFSQPTVSTVCGHIYCEDCIKSVIQSSRRCPTCRKTLTLKKIHPIYL